MTTHPDLTLESLVALDDRLRTAISNLTTMADEVEVEGGFDQYRLRGKVEGVALAMSYLSELRAACQ